MPGSHGERSQGNLEQLAQTAYPLVDAGSTPMWHPPSSLQQDSALRSTLAQFNNGDNRKDSVVDITSASLKVPRTPTCGEHQAESREPAPSEDANAVSPTQGHSIITFTPINEPRLPPHILPTNSDLFAHRYNRSIPELKIDYYDVEMRDIGLLNRDDRRMYHSGHLAGKTYSGTFVDERALPLETLAHIDKKLEEQHSALRVAEGPRREREVRALLETGSSLVLRKTSCRVEEADETICALQGCLSRSECIPPSTYWFSVQKLGIIAPSQQEEGFCFCLECLEWLWQGHEYTDKPPHPGVLPASGVGIAPANLLYEPEYVPHSPLSDVAPEEGAFSIDGVASLAPTCSVPSSICYDHAHHADALLQLDGSADPPATPTAGHGHSPISPFSGYGSPVRAFGETPPSIEAHNEGTQRWRSLCASRHATPDYRSQRASEAEEGRTSKSPDSIDSDGAWHYPPTRFQHIAAYIKPGFGLSTEDKAAVWLWKAASQEQLRWELHLRKANLNRNYYAGRNDDSISAKLLDFKIDDGDNGEDTVKHWEQLTGMQKEDCRGNNLSEVLHQTSGRQQATKHGAA